MSTLDFAGRVAVITGAGQGLGRSYALELARRGARLVVNDIDLSAKGDERSLVEEIAAIGGEAIASSDSVENGDRIIEQALDAYGRIDILINNAGLLRNGPFLKMSEDEWDVLYRVHLLGTMRVTKAAWPHMREARYGRVLMTTSVAGTFGILGAANYAAMKAATIGLTQSLAIEGETRNVKVNAVAPMAASRLTTHWPDKVRAALTTDSVARGVMLLLHERCPVSGRIFEVGGGWFSELRWQQNEGVLLGADFTAEEVESRWDAITQFPDGAEAYRSKDYLVRIEELTGERMPY